MTHIYHVDVELILCFGDDCGEWRAEPFTVTGLRAEDREHTIVQEARNQYRAENDDKNLQHIFVATIYDLKAD